MILLNGALQSDGLNRVVLADLVAQLNHPRTHLANRHQSQDRTQHSAREQGFALAKGSRTDLDDQFVQQAGIVKLTREVSASDNPDVPAAGGFPHLRVDVANISTSEPDVRAIDCWKFATEKIQAGSEYGHAVPVSAATLSAFRIIHS